MDLQSCTPPSTDTWPEYEKDYEAYIRCAWTICVPSLEMARFDRDDLKQLYKSAPVASRGEADAQREQVLVDRTHLPRKHERLLQAHYGDAISLDLFKKEQDRIRAELDAGTRHEERLAATADVTDRMLELALDVMTDCPRAYRNAPDDVRRLFYQTFSEQPLA